MRVRIAIESGAPGHYLVAAYAGSTPAGSLYVYTWPDADVIMLYDRATERAPQAPGMWMSHLWVEPEFRQQGIATKLVAAALDEGKRRGMKHGWVDEHVHPWSARITRRLLRQMGARVHFRRYYRGSRATAQADLYWIF